MHRKPSGARALVPSCVAAALAVAIAVAVTGCGRTAGVQAPAAASGVAVLQPGALPSGSLGPAVVNYGSGPVVVDASRMTPQQRLDMKWHAYLEALVNTPELRNLQRDFVKDDLAALKAPAGKSGRRSLGNVVDPVWTQNLARTVDAAAAQPGDMPDVDAAAHDFVAAERALLPIAQDLSAYNAAKGYLADDGQKARDLADPYLAAMHRVELAQDTLNAKLELRDIVAVSTEFSNAKPLTLGYYATGMRYFGMKLLQDAQPFLDKPADPALQDAFAKALDQFFDMSTHWLEEERKAHPEGCPGVVAEISPETSVVGSARDMLRKQRTGVYAHDEAKYGKHDTRGGLDDDAWMFKHDYLNMRYAEARRAACP